MSYDSILSLYGDQSPVEVETSWGVPVVVHPVSIGRHVDSLGDGSVKPVYAALAAAVEVDGEYWTPEQWAALPKKSMDVVMDIYLVYEQVNGGAEDLEKK